MTVSTYPRDDTKTSRDLLTPCASCAPCAPIPSITPFLSSRIGWYSRHVGLSRHENRRWVCHPTGATTERVVGAPSGMPAGAPVGSPAVALAGAPAVAMSLCAGDCEP